MKTIDFDKYLKDKISDPKFKKGFDREYQKLKKSLQKHKLK